LLKICFLIDFSDGWDRTAQLSALVQLLLDSHYRTYIGFMSLIEKEWLSFGHRFQDRCGLGPRSPQEESPIFVQFIDIVWQILRQVKRIIVYVEIFSVSLFFSI
jgi:hypothetical protein